MTLRKVGVFFATLAVSTLLIAGNIKTVDGVARANVKTVATVESANLKTIMAVDSTSGPVVKDDQLGTSTSDGLGVGISYYKAGKWTAGSSYTLTQVVVRMAKSGSPTMTITPHIYSDNSDTPNVSLGSGTAFAASGIASGENTLTGFNVSISSGTKYWLVMVASATDGSNYINWWIKDTNFLTNGGLTSSDGTTWTLSKARQISLKTYANP